ncbi:NUDIX domain-containing protein [Ferroacidibacillus organovorans]|uniref:NUDIX hydrolase n=1 Tax=Ferroacidibacillus organovorans TaxID=1765683 RepID=A0A162S2A7_9BACL|nr:NUDIX domain-containing protein [Ferroacidibacillus organovorans]KYP79457.1 NUDIX hydrolase [Ferroacidibacillus organovorans]OAG94511.1 NUDIX hydrolase [Ferroacidibacillus organovorans]OPG15478.1 NUDIX hydrolase [Ferroacidibacillus organovorans]
MPMSDFYQNLRSKIGTDLIFSPSVAAIIRDKEGKILFQRPTAESVIWSLPAGAIELGETPSQAVVREVWEETGLNVTPMALVGAFGGQEFRFRYADGNQVEYVVLVFDCKVDSGELEAIDGESFELRYFTVEQMPPLALPYPKRIFQQKRIDSALFN